MKDQAYQKKSVAVLNADVVGYSRLMSDDLESTTDMMMTCRKIVEKEINKSKGLLVDFVGDNFMAVFNTSMKAVQTAITISTEMENLNKELPDTRQIRFRMGMDIGEVIITDDKYYGDALNIAARIQPMALSGGICVSQNVYIDLDEPALRFRPIGQKRLKNIPEEAMIYEFADLPADGGKELSRKSLSLDSPTVAVLPMHIPSNENSISMVAEIFKKELIHRLSSIPQLNVTDAQSQTVVKDGLPAARYMVESGVYQVKDKILVYAVLFDVTTMNIVKSYKWTVKEEEFFEHINQFTEDVARSVEVELVVGEPAGLYAELDDPEAIERIYKGWYFLRSDTREGWVHALELFDMVMGSHPDHPYGYVLTAYAYLIGAANEWASDPESALAEARDLAEAGFKAGDLTGMSKAVEASILMTEGKHEEALLIVDELEIIRPTCDVTYGLAGSVRRYIGQWEKSIDMLDFAMHLTAVNKPWYPTVKSCSLFMGGKVEQAAATAEMVLEYQPRNLEALLVLAAAQLESGMIRRARATTNTIQDLFPSVDVEAWLEKNPYTSKHFIHRWKSDLESAGAISIHQ